MAITSVDYDFFVRLRESGIVPAAPHILELGESNCYDDFDTSRLVDDIQRLVTDAAKRKALMEELGTISNARDLGYLFDLSKVFFKTFLNAASVTSVDFHGTTAALPYDLNVPVPLDKTFDILLNLGTAEHVFNVYQLFKSVHELTAPGGLMIHELPLHGWFDHGFYNFQPTFYFDLAGANHYVIEQMALVELTPSNLHYFTTREEVLSLYNAQKLGPNMMITAVLRKPAAGAEFRTPMQGYYFGETSAEVKSAWKSNR